MSTQSLFHVNKGNELILNETMKNQIEPESLKERKKIVSTM